ncbi:TPA: HAD-IA family hydrolase [Aeromonas veronii]
MIKRLGSNYDTAQLLSFDIFDTLIFRRAGSPNDFFRFLANELTEHGLWQGEVERFVQLRRKAEENARSRKQELTGHREVDLREIYAAWPAVQGDLFAQVESQTECRNWTINPIVAYWISVAQQQGKRVALVSDMYLDTDVIRDFLLANMGSRTPELILISGEQGCSKHDAGLFKRLFELTGVAPEKILHIGDNPIGDGQMPRAQGMMTHVVEQPDYLRNIRQAEAKLAEPIACLDALRQMWQWQHGSLSSASMLGGFIYGPLLWWLANWLITRCRKLGVDTLVCLLREGQILANVLEVMGASDIKVKTLAISRRSTYLPSFECFDVAMLYELAKRRGYTLGECLEDIGITAKPEWHDHLSKPLSQLVKKSLWSDITAQLSMQQTEISAYLSNQRQLFSEFLSSQQISNSSSIAFWDWGCGGSLFANLCRVAPFDHCRFFLAYGSEKSTQFALEHHLEVFFPVDGRSQVLASAPEVSEILLNGHQLSTRAYCCKEGTIQAVPVQAGLMSEQGKAVIEQFNSAVVQFCSIAATARLDIDLAATTRKSLAALLYRFIQYPELQEASSLSALAVPLSEQTSAPLIDSAAVESIRKNFSSIYQAFAAETQGRLPNEPGMFWVSGALAIAFPGSMAMVGELGVQLGDEMVPPMLVSALKNQDVTKVAVYGAGELGERLIGQLKEQQITITSVVDRRAQSGPFTVAGFEVVSLDEALERGERVFVIASKAFAAEIVKSMNHVAASNGIELTIISLLEANND